MPFVTGEHREHPDPTLPGDRCYVWYKWMIAKWQESRRWTTADAIYFFVQQPERDPDQQRAKELAWQVFFVKEVMVYEEEKMEENGDI